MYINYKYGEHPNIFFQDNAVTILAQSLLMLHGNMCLINWDKMSPVMKQAQQDKPLLPS